jgi:RimJ/RimL family protein N-acetyltransferase
MDLIFENDIILENNRAFLRPLKIGDIEKLLPIATSDKDLIKYTPSQIYTQTLLAEYIENAIKDRIKKTRYPFVIFDKTQNAYAGSTSFLNISNYDKRLEIGGTWIGKQFQKTGLNRNCKFLLLSYLFDELQFERVELKTDERNLNSRKAIEKIGGKFEGVFRSHMLMGDGFRRNTVYYSILKEEWPDLKIDFKI